MDKKLTSTPSESISPDLKKRAEIARKKYAHKPDRSELLRPQEIADGAPFYFVLRAFVKQLKDARALARKTLQDVSEESGIAVESLSRLETGAQTNPTWKTLGNYAIAVGMTPKLVAVPELRINGVSEESEPTSAMDKEIPITLRRGSFAYSVSTVG